METCVSKHALNGARHVKMSPIVYRATTDTLGYPVKYLVPMDAKETFAKKSMGRVYHADLECLSCSQADGSCTQCKKNTKNGPNCTLECSTTCNISVCGIDGTCTYGCITNTFGKKCVNKCADYCLPKINSTLCFEGSGMCLYGCQTGYRGKFCPQEAEQQPLSIGTLCGIIGGVVIALSVSVGVGFVLMRRRRNKFSNECKPSEKEHENLSTLHATVKKGKPSQAEYANRETVNLHSVIIIENPEYESPQTNSSCKSKNPVLTEDSLEI
ncbi:hypothetical protein MAR_031367, partial [Mya arenaria]